MKIVAIGDTHGRAFWKWIAANEPCDKLVFIGDYFDSFELSFLEQVHNFKEICAYKRANPDQVVLLIGNHDFHYMAHAMSIGENYSGYQGARAWEIRRVIEENLDILQMAWQWEKFLFTHAGVTDIWFNWTMGLDRKVKVELEVPYDEYINQVFVHTPKMFTFRGRNPYGDDPTQSPIWVRPASLMKHRLGGGIKQVVGHTGQDALRPRKDAAGNDKFYFIDTLGHSREYLILEDSAWRAGQC